MLLYHFQQPEQKTLLGVRERTVAVNGQGTTC